VPSTIPYPHSTTETLNLQFHADLYIGQKKLVPKLTLCVQFEDGVVTDVALSPATRQYLQILAAKQEGSSSSPDDINTDSQSSAKSIAATRW